MRKSDWRLVILGSIIVVGIAIYVYPIQIPKQDLPISSSCSEKEETSPPTSLPFPHYDFFYFVQTWPPTFCRHREECVHPLPKGFTIHGLWPQSDGDRPLTSCCDTKDPRPDCPFNLTKAINGSTKILQDLERVWPTLKKRQKDQQFLSNEWEKHGTCSLLNVTQTEYFQNSLRLYHTSDLNLAILKSPRLKNGKISIEGIKEAVRNKTRSTALVMCNPSNELLEIRLCADVNAKEFRDCSGKPDNCSIYSPIFIP